MKRTVKKFRLKEEHITQVPREQAVQIVFANGKTLDGVSYGTIDHPEFEKLREQLGKEGYIEIERGWWNGDRVVKPFSLNGFPFKAGDSFPCGMALSIRMDVAKRKGIK